MDPKKSNLTPELKEIYDRVMNTTATPKTPPKAPVAPQVSKADTAPSMNSLNPAPSVNTASLNPSPPTPAEDALTNTPARPLSSQNTFSFSGKAEPMPEAPSVSLDETVSKKKKSQMKLSLPILITLGIAFIIVWGLFWAVMFGIIKR
jgi:hypothetical protein